MFSSMFGGSDKSDNPAYILVEKVRAALKNILFLFHFVATTWNLVQTTTTARGSFSSFAAAAVPHVARLFLVFPPRAPLGISTSPVFRATPACCVPPQI
jgi:hypothetical protein